MGRERVQHLVRVTEDGAIEAEFTHVLNGSTLRTMTFVGPEGEWAEDPRSRDPSWYAVRTDGVVQAIKVRTLGDRPPEIPRYRAEALTPSSN